MHNLAAKLRRFLTAMRKSVMACPIYPCMVIWQDDDLAGGKLIDWRGAMHNLAAELRRTVTAMRKSMIACLTLGFRVLVCNTKSCVVLWQDDDLAGGKLIDWRGPSGDLASDFRGFLTSQTVAGEPYWKLLGDYAPPAMCLASPPPPPPPGAPATSIATPAPTILPGTCTSSTIGRM